MAIIKNDLLNTEFQLAADYIIQTGKSLFLTGKAGTGKTTFLKYIQHQTAKNMAVVAPTGVAAINAGGVTIHSFLQLPFAPFIPEHNAVKNIAADTTDGHNLLSRIRFGRDKKQLLQQLELLVIDEISMVRCDVMDAIDTVLRYFRGKQAPFGGVQVLFIGDMHQLPPVTVNEEWSILSQFYESPYFFSSKAMQQQQYAYVELKKIYRQRDNDFIHVLNQVRNNELDEEGYNLLHRRYQPSFKTLKGDGYIILTTHNYKANEVNNNELMKLKGELYNYKCLVKGEFFEKSYPADETLQLKIGAQVMFIKNDVDKRFYNGKIGTVTKANAEIITVECKESPPIEVTKETWRNIRYALNNESKKINEEEIGSFTQFPLRLAWAITIHKSQGLTFEKAVIDAGASFAPGQVYVALSRCTNLQGMVLLSRINANSLQTDKRITEFIERLQTNQSPDDIDVAKHAYQQNLVMQSFSFTAMAKQLEEVRKVVEQNASSFNAPTLLWLQLLQEKLYALINTSNKFQPQLQQLLQQPFLPEQNNALQNRMKAAAGHFAPLLENIAGYITQSPAITDNKQYAAAYNEELQLMYNELIQQVNIINSLQAGFQVSNWNNAKALPVTQRLPINSYAGSTNSASDSPHPDLYKQLKKLRDKLCNEQNMPVYLVAASGTLYEMCRYLPQTEAELIQVSGFGKSKASNFGLLFLNIIKEYSQQNNLQSLIHEKQPKQKRKNTDVTDKEQQAKTVKTDSKQTTFQLYKEGKTINEIAAGRNFSPQTIEGHLAHFVQTGELSVDELVSREKFIMIEPVLKNTTITQLTPVKQQLGDAVSYGEIRLVMAALTFEKNKNDGSK